MSVRKICKAGYRIVFDDEGSYVEDKATGEAMRVTEEDGEYIMDVWVKTDEQGNSTFRGQVQSP